MAKQSPIAQASQRDVAESDRLFRFRSSLVSECRYRSRHQKYRRTILSDHKALLTWDRCSVLHAEHDCSFAIGMCCMSVRQQGMCRKESYKSSLSYSDPTNGCIFWRELRRENCIQKVRSDIERDTNLGDRTGTTSARSLIVVTVEPRRP